jgi:plasmid stability protein
MLMVVTRSIQIRDVPEDVHAVLRARAAAARMSLSEYLLQIVEQHARRPTIAEVLERAGSRSRPHSLTAEAVLDAVRAAREDDDGE